MAPVWQFIQLPRELDRTMFIASVNPSEAQYWAELLAVEMARKTVIMVNVFGRILFT